MSEEIAKQVHAAIAAKLPDATIEVSVGGPGHFTIDVVSTAFEGKTMVAKQRLVYSAISHLMGGDDAPVHAIDKLHTRVPG